MNKIVHKVLIPGDNFLHQLHLRQPWFTYNAYGPIQKFSETGHINHI